MPSILQDIQTGLAARGEMQRQGMLSREEANRQRLQALAEEQQAEQLETRELAMEGDQAAINAAFAQDPAMGEKIFKRVGANTQAKKEEWAAFATNIIDAPDPDTIDFLIDERIRKLGAEGRDATETLQLKDLEPQQLLPVMQGMKAAALTEKQRQDISARGRVAAGQKAFAPVTLFNPKTGEKVPYIPTFDPATGKAKLEKADLPEGFEISKETAEEKRQAEVAIAEEKKGAEIRGKKIATREQASIDEGLIAADGYANLKRAKSLLDGIETGGFSNAALSAKRLFGVESANEAELSNRMGKAVLSQLRTTFGAAFTATEGESLKQIEANFGKSTAGNKRLIAQTMRLVERAANRGIRAARKSGDLETLKEIEDAMAFTLETEAPLPQGVTEEDITETMRIHGITRQQVIDRLGGQ